MGGTESVLRQRRTEVEDELHEIEAESLRNSLSEGFYSDDKKMIRNAFKEQYDKRKDLIIFLNIVHGSVWGVLARLGIMSLTSYPGSYLQGVIWANFGACIVMGMMVESVRIWETLTKLPGFSHKGSIPLYTGITTGFCGTFSSFSSFILEAFEKSTNTEPSSTYEYPNAAYGIMEFLAVVIAQLGISLLGYHFGKHIMELTDKFYPSLSKRINFTLEIASSLIGIIGFIITCVLIGVKDSGAWRSWLFSIFFAPFGALTRFYLSKTLNSSVKNFPLGTFVANVSGSILLSILTLLSRGKKPGDTGGQLITNILNCHVITGIEEGFCGALTTVSTFVVELVGLKVIHSYKYGFTSIFFSYIFFILILGIYNWKVGLTESVC